MSSSVEKPAGWDALWDDAATEVPGLVEEFRAKMKERALAHGLDPSREVDIDLVRVVPPTEWGEVFAQCVRDQGFEAKVVEGGTGIEFAEYMPDDQVEPFTYAVFRCDMQYVMHPFAEMVPPRPALEVLYDFLVTETLPCVREHGYDIDDPPSKVTWVEAYTKQQHVWTPLEGPLTDVSDGARREETLADCPAFPDWFYPIS